MYCASNLPYLLLIYPFLTPEGTYYTNSINNKLTTNRLIGEHNLTQTSICRKAQINEKIMKASSQEQMEDFMT